jgi:DNA-binding PadR family transcriptional regulator
MKPNRERGWHQHSHHHDPEAEPMRGPGGPRRGRRGGRGRATRGDVRYAVLSLLAEEPMHGYQLMQAISERTGGRWTPSPGAIYPTISQLEDEGLVTVTEESGRKLVTLTDAGREFVESRETDHDPFAEYGEAGHGADLRGLLPPLLGAVREVWRNGTDAQRATAADILRQTRRSLYLLLADDSESTRDELA